jgi:predicted Zn finger-like uncharacterized protein
MTTDAATLHVSCPKCDAQYLLPTHLLGPGGARVRCPACRDSFDVPPLSAPEAPEPAAPPVAAAPSAPPSPASAGPPTGAPVVSSEGSPVRPGMPSPETSPVMAVQASRETARSILAELATREGGALERAASEGRLFAQFGPAIFAAWDEYKKRAEGGGAASFREALRERWGVDLPEITPR